MKNNWRMKRILDEPPCRASMKNSGNKRMIKRKGSWKHKVKPCDDLDGASWRDNAENLELRKRKDEAFEMLHLFFFGVSSFPHYLVAKLHLNHRKASPCVFNFSFFLPSFHYRSSSWRLYMMVHQRFNSSRSVHRDSFQRSSRILHLAFWSAILPTLSFEVVLCHCR